jgi:hypothetical protein
MAVFLYAFAAASLALASIMLPLRGIGYTIFLDIPKVNARSLPGEGVRDLPSPSTIANLYGG